MILFDNGWFIWFRWKFSLKWYYDLGYYGVDCIYFINKWNYYWFSLYEDLIEYMNFCILCKERNF